MKIIDVPVEKIEIGDRHRRDMGDIEALAANIGQLGLLQPIGVDEHFHLIYGARRFDACTLILEWKTVPCVVVKMKSLLAGEFSENEFRKQFTPTERAAIGKAIEEETPKRQGGDRRSSSANAEVGLKGNTVDIAAKAAGFKSAETFERAKTVADRGAPELQQAMDKGKVSIAAAAVIASQPKAEQKRIVAMPKDEQREVIQQIRRTRADREADERRARDILLYRGIYNHVKGIADFCESPKDTWDGIWRVSGYDFADLLDKASEYLQRLKKEHPNAPRKPARVS